MNGIIFYNIGFKMLVRLSVSLYTLRRNYSGDVTVICDEDSFNKCKKITDLFDVNILKVKNDLTGKNIPFLNKCLLHKFSPYDNTIFLDCDTLILKNFDELFDYFKNYEFFTTKFSSWTINKIISKRIKAWTPYFPNLIKPALNFGFAINTGVFGFRKDSKLMNDWFSYAVKGKDLFIPDETSCQLILHKYNHKLVSHNYNTSCKFDKITDDTRIIHFHGRKHCRIQNGEFLFNSKLWYKEFDKISFWSSVEDVFKYDRMLKNNIEKRI